MSDTKGHGPSCGHCDGAVNTKPLERPAQDVARAVQGRLVTPEPTIRPPYYVPLSRPQMPK